MLTTVQCLSKTRKNDTYFRRIFIETTTVYESLIGENIAKYLFLVLASKNHRGEKYGVDHQAMAKDVEVTREQTNLDVQRRIDEAHLQIASVS